MDAPHPTEDGSHGRHQQKLLDLLFECNKSCGNKHFWFCEGGNNNADDSCSFLLLVWVYKHTTKALLVQEGVNLIELVLVRANGVTSIRVNALVLAAAVNIHYIILPTL